MEGNYILPHDYRFGIRARLNKIPTRSLLKRIRRTGNDECRHCESKETLAHVLQHCQHNMALIRDRHKLILNRIGKSLAFVERTQRHIKVSIDKKPEGYQGDLVRPDIILENQTDNTVTIVDLVITSEDCLNKTMDQRRQEKIQKYKHLSEWYSSQGKTAKFEALVYGNIGAIAPENYDVLTGDLRIQHGFAKLMQRYISLDIIAQSNRIWWLHKR